MNHAGERCWIHDITIGFKRLGMIPCRLASPSDIPVNLEGRSLAMRSEPVRQAYG